jgi:hypothetical protein
MTLAGRTPNKEESLWMDRIVQVGCIVCRIFKQVESPAEIHHLDGKTKPEAHKRTLPLCPCHHRIPGKGWVSRADGKKAFEAEYLPEDDLLEITQALVTEMVLRGYLL